MRFLFFLCVLVFYIFWNQFGINWCYADDTQSPVVLKCLSTATTVLLLVFQALHVLKTNNLLPYSQITVPYKTSSNVYYSNVCGFMISTLYPHVTFLFQWVVVGF